MRAEEAIEKRVSVRKFSERSLSASDLKKIIDAGRLAATANNIQPVEFIIVQDKDRRKKMSALAPKNGPYMEYAPAVIAVISQPETYYLEDGSASTQNILVMARALGIGSVWIAGDKKDYAPEILRLLGAPADYRLVSLVCLGYPEKDFPTTPKKHPSEVRHWEMYGVSEEEV
ncbi:MAG: nitroreductase family protein [Elusimicrobia bacterium]|nr:nitroreductase family protein [Elusimicrobiota bacterium]